MARLDPTGVSRILSYIKTWVTNALGGKANSSHTHSDYIPKSGGGGLGTPFSRAVNNDEIRIDGGTGWNDGASLSLSGKNRTDANGNILLHTTDGTNTSDLLLAPNGTFFYQCNGTYKNVAMQEDVNALLNGKANSSHTHTKSQITDFPTIPTNTSQLANDSGFITSSGSCNYANSAGSAGSATTAEAVSTSVAADSSKNLFYCSMADNDFCRINCGGSSNAGYLEIATADDGNEPIYVRQYTGVFSSVTRTLTLLDGSGNTQFPGTLYTYNGAVIRRNGIPTPGWGYDANTQSVLQIRTEDNTEPSICLHRSGYSHIVLAEQGGQFGVHAQGGTFDRCNTESYTVLNGYRIYVG